MAFTGCFPYSRNHAYSFTHIMSLNLCAVILQVRKLRFRKDRKLTQSHVASQCRPRSRDCNITLLTFLCPVIFFLSSYYLESHVPSPRGWVLIDSANFGSTFTPAVDGGFSHDSRGLYRNFCSVTPRKHFPHVRRYKRKPFYSYRFLSF